MSLLSRAPNMTDEDRSLLTTVLAEFAMTFRTVFPILFALERDDNTTLSTLAAATTSPRAAREFVTSCLDYASATEKREADLALRAVTTTVHTLLARWDIKQEWLFAAFKDSSELHDFFHGGDALIALRALQGAIADQLRLLADVNEAIKDEKGKVQMELHAKNAAIMEVYRKLLERHDEMVKTQIVPGLMKNTERCGDHKECGLRLAVAKGLVDELKALQPKRLKVVNNMIDQIKEELEAIGLKMNDDVLDAIGLPKDQSVVESVVEKESGIKMQEEEEEE